MIDWHCHILPEIDDGADNIEESLAMAGSLREAGFSQICCTPHLMKGCYEATSSQVRLAVAAFQEQVDAAGIDLRLHPCREYCLDEYLMDYLSDPLPILDDKRILVEIPQRLSGEMIRQLAYRLVRSGFVPVIAHPERCHQLEPRAVRRQAGGMLDRLKRLFGTVAEDELGDTLHQSGNPLLDYLRDLGCSFQGNLGSFSGFYGSHVRSVALFMHRLGIYDRFGSDLHSPGHADAILRPPFPN